MEYDNLPEASGGRFWLIAGYFFLMAVLMVPANALGLGMMGILIVMVVAGILLGGVLLLFKFIRRKMSNLNLSRRQWIEMMSGVPASSQVVDAEPSPETSLVTRKLPSTDLVPITRQDLPDRIIEHNGLHLADAFMPAIHTLLGQVVLICGVRRYGKSNLLAVFVEEMAPYELPMLIVDTQDEFEALADHAYLPRGYRAGSLDGPRDQQNYAGLRVCDGYQFGRHIVEQQLQVVLNMASYTGKDEAALVLCEIVRGMNEWEEEHENDKRKPLFLFMDEASTWLPQEGRVSEVAKTTQSYLYRTFFGTVVNRGGKMGWGAVFATQRIQQIHKAALQAPWKFLFYQTQKVDLDQYGYFGLSSDKVMSLQKGECYIFSPTVIGFRTFMRECNAPHAGHTPGLDALQAYRNTLRPVHTLAFAPQAPMPVEKLQDQEERAAHGPAPVTTPHPGGTTTHEDTPQQLPVHAGLSRKQQEALNLYKRGIVAHREIAATMHISESDAYRILVQLDAAGYIQRRKQQIQA